MPRAHITSQPEHVPLHGLYELTLGFDPEFSNPFDTSANGIEVEFVQPSGRNRSASRSRTARHRGHAKWRV